MHTYRRCVSDAELAFLRRRFGDDTRISVMRPGEWSSVYAVRTDDADLVARFSAYDEDFEKDAKMARHASAALPIPPILEWGPATSGFYAIASRVGGEHLDALDETRTRAVLPALFAALDAIREIDLSGASGFGGWRGDRTGTEPTWRAKLVGVATEAVTRDAPGWREVLGASPTGVAPFEEGYARLLELVGHCPEDRYVIHDDLINRNVLVAGDRITAVLDWGSSMYGDFLYDLAKLVFYRPWFTGLRDIDVAAAARAHYDAIGLSVPHFAERLACYSIRIGLADMAYSAWRQRWDQVERKAARTLELARG